MSFELNFKLECPENNFLKINQIHFKNCEVYKHLGQIKVFWKLYHIYSLLIYYDKIQLREFGRIFNR